VHAPPQASAWNTPAWRVAVFDFAQERDSRLSLALLFALCLFRKNVVTFRYVQHLLTVRFGEESVRHRPGLFGEPAPIIR